MSASTASRCRAGYPCPGSATAAVRLQAVVLSLIALLLTACAAEERADYPVSEDATPAPVEEVTWNHCTNTAAGYTVEYPQEWHTNTSGRLDDCSLFDPEPVDVPEEPRGVPLDVAVMIRVEPVDFPDFTAADTAVVVTEEERVEVDGHMAVRQDLVATGQGLYPEGTESIRYAVGRDGETLVAETFSVGEPSYQRKVEVLDEMVSSLEFTDEQELDARLSSQRPETG